MSLHHGWTRAAAVFGSYVAVWLAFRYLFPLFLPFILGFAISLPAEPVAKIMQQRFRLPQAAASFAAVAMVLAMLCGIITLASVLLVQRAAALAGTLGDTAQQLSDGIATVRDWAVGLAAKAPGELSGPLEESVRNLFRSGGALADRGAEAALGLAGRFAGNLTGVLMTLGTAVLSAFLLCPRLPRLRSRLQSWGFWKNGVMPVLQRLRRSIVCWLRAQLRLSGLTFCIVLAGYFLLNVDNKLPMALLTAVVDAVPLLGTGTVLLPWALVCFLSAQPVRAVGLLGVYVTALVTRSALEPRLVGRQLGLDPLVALAALYAGWRIWGFWGMVLAPILTVTAKEVCHGD